MSTLKEALARTKTITFDCYGTLIDWAGGLRRSFAQAFGPEQSVREDTLFDAYVRAEAEEESKPYRPYRDILAATTERLANQLGFELPKGASDILAHTLPDWTPFPDTNEALGRLKEKFTLGVLSNIDRDLFAGTSRHLAVEFDFLIVAEDVRSYKPSCAHFERLLETHGPRETILHVAQSLHHDGVPAGELGIPFVWINRYGETTDGNVGSHSGVRGGQRMLAEFSDLRSFADIACGD